MSTVYNALRRDSSLVLTHAVLFGSLQHRAPKTSHGTFGSKCFAFFEYTYLQVNHLVRHPWRILSCVLELKHFARFVQSRSCNGKKLLLSFLFVFLNSGANPLLSTAVAVHWRATSAYVPKWRWSRPADFYMIPLCSEVEISPPPLHPVKWKTDQFLPCSWFQKVEGREQKRGQCLAVGFCWRPRRETNCPRARETSGARGGRGPSGAGASLPFLPPLCRGLPRGWIQTPMHVSSTSPLLFLDSFFVSLG